MKYNKGKYHLKGKGIKYNLNEIIYFMTYFQSSSPHIGYKEKFIGLKRDKKGSRKNGLKGLKRVLNVGKNSSKMEQQASNENQIR